MPSSVLSPRLHHKFARFLGLHFRGLKGIDFLLRSLHHPDKRTENYVRTIVSGVPEGALYEIETRWYTEWTTYFYGSQDAKIHQWIKDNAQRDWVTMDIGMNYGYFTCLLAKLCKSTYGFEPVEWLAERARSNLDLNKFDNAVVKNLALSDRRGTIELNLPSEDDSNWGTSSIVHKSSSSNSISVETTTLDEVCDLERISRLDFIKLDVEGAEHLVLKGGQRTLENFRPTIIFENNPESFGEIELQLQSLGYSLLNLNGIPVSSCREMPHDILALPSAVRPSDSIL